MLDGYRSLPLSGLTDVAELQTLLRLPLPEDWRDTWTTPGQYLKMTTHDEEKPSFFVIANAPGADHLEVLIKEASPVTAALRSLSVGSAVQVSPPMGNGFPIETATGQDVLLLAAGSGIAAIRPVLQQLLQSRGSCGQIHLLYGERTPQRVAFQEEIADWEKLGVDAHICLSAAVDVQAEVLPGYVQDHLRLMAPQPKRTIGFLSGMEAMLVACRSAFSELGGDPSRLYTNF